MLDCQNTFTENTIDMAPKLHIILNPSAGWHRAQRESRILYQALQHHHISYEVHTTSHAGHARKLGRQLSGQGVTQIGVLGGDGTYHEVINGIMHSPGTTQPILGFIPGGSSNDLAQCLNTDTSVEKFCQNILQNKTRSIDLGKVNGNYFVLASALGLFADAAKRSNHLKGLYGQYRYLAAGFFSIMFTRNGWNMELEFSDQKLQGNYSVFMLSNLSRFGVLRLVPESSADDGLMEAVLIDWIPNKWRAIDLLRLARQGRLMDHPHLRIIRTDKLRLTIHTHSELNLDGELYPHQDTYEFQVVPRKLRVFSG